MNGSQRALWAAQKRMLGDQRALCHWKNESCGASAGTWAAASWHFKPHKGCRKGLFVIEICELRSVLWHMNGVNEPPYATQGNTLRGPKGSWNWKMRAAELPLAHERRAAGTLSSAEKNVRWPKGSLPLKSESCGASAGTWTAASGHFQQHREGC